MLQQLLPQNWHKAPKEKLHGKMTGDRKKCS